MPTPGPLELVIILVIALLILGPGRLPDVGSALGKSLREFRKASSDIQDAVKVDTTPLPPDQAAASQPTAAPAAPSDPAAAAAPVATAAAATPAPIAPDAPVAAPPASAPGAPEAQPAAAPAEAETAPVGAKPADQPGSENPA